MDKEKETTKTAPEEVEKKETKVSDKKLKKDEYIEGIGRRKRSVARVRIYTTSPAQSIDKKGFSVNEGKGEEYFTEKQIDTVLAPLRKLKALDKFKLSARVSGGGITGQAEAVRMGLSRALVSFDETFRNKLKKSGYLTRDQREKERKKPGLKKARRAPQWSKR